MISFDSVIFDEKKEKKCIIDMNKKCVIFIYFILHIFLFEVINLNIEII